MLSSTLTSISYAGEIAAAFAARYITAADAIVVAYQRGQILSKSSTRGAMMAVGLGSDSASKMLLDSGYQDQLVIGCVNSPQSVTISGNEDAIDALAAACQEKNIYIKRLSTGGKAYHSQHMLSLGQEYENMISDTFLQTEACQRELMPIPMISSVIGQLVDPSQTRTATYWRKNLESPVLFKSALEVMCSERPYYIVEIGPHPALKLPIAQTRKAMGVEESNCIYSPTLFRGSNSITDMLELAGSLFLHGYDIKIDNINHHQEPILTGTEAAVVKRQILRNLPKQKWEYGPLLWHESRISREFRARKHPLHELLGARVPGGNGKTMAWRSLIKAKNIPWLGDHKLGQTIVFPAAAYLALATEALRQVLEFDIDFSQILVFRQVRFLKALALLDENSSVEVFTELRPLDISSTTTSLTWWQFKTSSHSGHASTLHANGSIGLDMVSKSISPALRFSDDSMEWQPMRNWYKRMPACNINPGPSFHSLAEIKVDRMRIARQAVAKTKPGLPSLKASPQSHYFVHPTMIDALLQTAWIAGTAGSIESLRGEVPVSIGSIKMTTAIARLASESHNIRGISEPVGFQSAMFSSELYDLDGTVQLQMQEMRGVPYQEGTARNELSGERHPMLRLLWRPDLSLLRSNSTTIIEESGDMIPSSVQSRFPDPETKRLAVVLDLLAHKNPNLKILVLGHLGQETISAFREMLHEDLNLKRFNSLTQASWTASGHFMDVETNSDRNSFDLARDQPKPQFDVIIMPTVGDN